MSEFDIKIAKGMQLLDAQAPGWRDKVDLNSLDLGSCAVCVLGQVYGDYEDGIEQLNINGYEYGFNTTQNMAGLTAAWKDALGKNNELVEKGQIYVDEHGRAVTVVATEIVTLTSGDTVTLYLSTQGEVYNFKYESWGDNLIALRKSDFEDRFVKRYYPINFTTGEFLTNDDGEIFYVVDSRNLRYVKEGGHTTLLSYLPEGSRAGLRPLVLSNGAKLSSVPVV